MSSQRYEEVKTLLRRLVPVARRVLGENDELTLKMRQTYAGALYLGCATLDELREAVTRLEEVERTARRVLGGAHPTVLNIERSRRVALLKLRAHETPPGSA